jgi:hypothetical protein
MDISTTDLHYILNNISSNSAVLFLGAGFSADATNRAGNTIPVGNTFAANLWKFIGYPGPYDGTPLARIYEAALTKKHSDLQHLLEETFTCEKIPAWYQILAKIFWLRIYTTNIDDLVEKIYKQSADVPRLSVRNGLTSDYEERDQFLASIQYVKLNGTLEGGPRGITFSTRQYADRLAKMDIWYDHFARDYSTRMTVFIGSKIDEPLFWQALAARGQKLAASDPSPKSFVVSRTFSPPELDALKSYKLVPLTGTAQEFFDIVTNAFGKFPSAEEVILNTNPDLAGMLKIRNSAISLAQRRSLEDFYGTFAPVKQHKPDASYRSFFLFGSEPQWQDIEANLDAAREINSLVVHEIQEARKKKEACAVVLHGYAGSGKSTCVKRVAHTLSGLAHPVFFTDSQELPAPHRFEGALDLLPGRSIIFFDNASLAMRLLPDYLTAAKRSKLKHVFVIAGRTNQLHERLYQLSAVCPVVEIAMSELTIPDIDNVLDVLGRTQNLGYLANKTRNQQRQVFLDYADNQILVAMRRATFGPGFEDIIKDEFFKLEPLEAKMLYMCASIATAAQFSISRQQLLACVNGRPAEIQKIISENLRGILVPTSNPDRFLARHRVIAELIVDRIAPRPVLKEAYVSLLQALAHDIAFAGRLNASARLYRRIINHATVYKRFSFHLQEARSIYASIAPFFSRDHHFWLQYGSLELEYGELHQAANYVEQAYQYAPGDDFVKTTKGLLLYKQSIAALEPEVAKDFRDRAREIINAQIQARPLDHYPFHIFCSGELNWINRWLSSTHERKVALEELRSFAKTATATHSTSKDIRNIAKAIEDAYLDLAKPGDASATPFNAVIK